ncbi:MAG: outer membrane receptor protein involved in Fe transport [Oceanicoccus sp.]|jgi:outer membrane receptor protein involved in Fe transport
MTIRKAPIGRSKLALAVAITTLTTGSQSYAQEGLFVEEILVTARKQTESLQDVPLALTAFSAKEIETQAIESTEDVVKFTPGLTFTRGIGGQDLRPDIRGLTPLSGRANVAILVDGVDMTSDALTGTGAGQLVSMGLYDLERVEIVRGPQSALFGRNAFGGAINYITKKPSAEFEGTINVEVAEWDTTKVKLGLSGPITDNVLYRLNIASSDEGGQYDNPENGKELGDKKNQSVSLALQFLPTDSLEILTRLDYSDSKAGHRPVGTLKANACVTEDYNAVTRAITGSSVDVRDCDTSAGEDAGAQYIGTVPDFDEDQIALSSADWRTDTELLQFTTLVNYEFADNYTFTSNTAFTDMEGTDTFDLDHTATTTSVGDCSNAPAFPGGPPGCILAGLSPFQLSQVVFPWVSDTTPLSYVADRDYDREVIFQDFRLSFDAGDDVRWLIGAEYYDEKIDVENYSRANANLGREGGNTGPIVIGTQVTGFGPGGPTFAPVFAANLSWDGTPTARSREIESWGIYGSVDWGFVEDWELSVSFRYQEEEFDISYGNELASGAIPGLPLDVGACYSEGAAPIFPGGPLGAGNGASPPGCFAAITDEDYLPTTETSGDFDSFNPRVVLTHYYSDNVMLYASVAKGTKPGGHTIEPDISGAIGSDPSSLNYDQEKLISYELGWKTSWLNDRMVVNGAAFFMNNTDKQANTRQYVTYSGTPRSFVDNIGEAEITGIELQVAGVVTEYWTASLNYAYIDTEVTSYLNQSAAGIPSPARGTTQEDATAAAKADPDADQSGNQLPFTPEHNLQISSTFDFTLGDNIDAFFRIDGRYLSERYASTNNIVELDGYTVWDLKLGMTYDNLQVTAFINNIENESAPASAVTFPDFAQNLRQQVVSHPQDKRTAGVRLKYSF